MNMPYATCNLKPLESYITQCYIIVVRIATDFGNVKLARNSFIALT